MTGYVYQGTKRDLGIDLETVNAQILAARDPGARPPRPRLADEPEPARCGRGHLRTPANTETGSDGKPRCKPCRAESRNRSKQKAGTP